MCDLGLDVHLYNGHSTSGDFLYAGVPILTYPGDDWSSRAAASDLMMFDLPELIASSWAEYTKIAVGLVNDREAYLLARKKVELWRDAVPMFDMPRFAKNLGTGFKMAFQQWLDGKPFEDIDILDNVTWLNRHSHNASYSSQWPF